MVAYIHQIDPTGIEETMEFKKETKLDYHKHIRSHIDYICPRSGRTAHIPKSLECYEWPNSAGVFKSDSVY